MLMMEESLPAPGPNLGFLAQLNQFTSARIRLEDLFQEFVRSEGSDTLIAVIQESRNDKDRAPSYYDPNKGTNSPGAPQGSGSNVRSLLSKKSPKKRPQSEISSSTSPSKSTDATSPISSSLKDLSISETSHHIPPTGTSSSSFVSSSGVASNLFPVVDPLSSGTPKIASSSSVVNSGTTTTVAGTPVGSVERTESDNEEHAVLRRKATLDKIPVFYHPGRRNYVFNQQLHFSLEEDKLVKRLPEIEAFFKPFPGGIPIEKFVHVTKRLCGIPSFFNLPLCRRINEKYGDPDAGIPAPRTIGRAGRQPSGVKIKLKTFIKFWQQEIEPYDRIERFFRIIKKHDSDYIVKDDFIPFLQELLHFHPGLDFLEAHEEFQRKYALTVITRIFYKVNTSRSGKISLREVRKSNLFTACMHVDEETDINKVLDFFSYEHFYVIYCKFFELDSDKDSKLTKADLMKYGDHALSEAIVDRYILTTFIVGLRIFYIYFILFIQNIPSGRASFFGWASWKL